MLFFLAGGPEFGKICLYDTLRVQLQQYHQNILGIKQGNIAVVKNVISKSTDKASLLNEGSKKLGKASSSTDPPPLCLAMELLQQVKHCDSNCQRNIQTRRAIALFLIAQPEILVDKLCIDKSKAYYWNEYELTPLTLASYKGYFDIVAELLRRGADPNFFTRFNGDINTPLTMASTLGEAKCTRVLSDDYDSHNTDPDCRPYSCDMVQSEHYDVYFKIIEILFEYGADPDLSDKNIEETYYGGLEEPVQHENFGLTPLSLATWQGDRTQVEYLLKQGANPNNRGLSNWGLTLLHLAIIRYDHKNRQDKKEYFDIAELLLKNGANPNIKANGRNVSKGTPLITACRDGYDQLVKLLFCHANVDLSIENEFGKTARDVTWEKDTSILDLLDRYYLYQKGNTDSFC